MILYALLIILFFAIPAQSFECEPQPLTTNATNGNPKIFHPWIVWTGYEWDRGLDNGYIEVYNIETGETLRLNDGTISPAANPIIENQILAWTDPTSMRWDKWGIFLYDLSTHKQVEFARDTENISGFDFEGEWMAWTEINPVTGNMDLLVMSISQPPTKVGDFIHNASPVIDQSTVVWVADVEGSSELMRYNLNTGLIEQITQLSLPPGSVRSTLYAPQIAGELVVWQQENMIDRSGGNYAYTHDLFYTNGETVSHLTAKLVVNTDALLHPPYLLWINNNDEGERDLFLHNLDTNTTMQITDDTLRETSPRINGDQIIWWVRETLYGYDIPTGETRVLLEQPHSYVGELGDGYMVWLGNVDAHGGDVMFCTLNSH